MRASNRLCSLIFMLTLSASTIACPAHGQVSVPPDTPAPAERSAGEACPNCPEEKCWEFPQWFPRILGAQADIIYQNMPPFHSPYEGPNSLTYQFVRGEQATQAYGVYVGSQLARGLQLYADGELFMGDGISDGLGLAGFVNGDVIRAGTSNLPKMPYLARLYLRYYYPLSGETEKLERGIDQLPGDQPVSRVEMKVGKLTPTDDFDLNRYANNNRTQFFNYDFLYNTAWDYACGHQGLYLRNCNGPVSAAMESGIRRLYGA